MKGLCRLLAISLGLCVSLAAEPPQMITRTYKVPPDFLVWDNSTAFTFSERLAKKDIILLHRCARQVLEYAGITFPANAVVTFDPTTSLLSVTNTQASLKLVAAFLDERIKQFPTTIAYSITVIEGPGELIRNANAASSKTADAAKELAALLVLSDKPDSNVRVVGDAFIELKAGNRASTEAVREHSCVMGFGTDTKESPVISPKLRPMGLKLKLEPRLTLDSKTMVTSLSLELNPGPLRQRQVKISDPASGNPAEFPAPEIPSVRFVTEISSASGMTKWIGITKPVGMLKENEDTLWAAFLTGTIRRLVALPGPKPAPPATTPQVPAGMTSARFVVPEDLFAAFMEPPDQPLRQWLISKDIQFPKEASIEHANGILHVINTQSEIENISALLDYAVSISPKTVALTLHTIQAPAALLRGLTHQSAAASDRAEMWAAVTAAVSSGEAKFIDSSFLETKPGSAATLEAVREHTYLSKFSTNDKGLPHLAFETRKVGTRFEADPTVGADGLNVELDFAHEFHPLAPETHRHHFRDPASKQLFEMPVVDFHSSKTVSRTTLTKGGIKLISLSKPPGNTETDVLWATFLKCDVVPQLGSARGEKAKLETPPKKLKPADASDQKLYIRTFRVPPDWLSDRSDQQSPDSAKHKAAHQAFEKTGIVFPEGARVSYDGAAPSIIVRNTTENLDKIGAFLAALEHEGRPRNGTFTTHVLQGPGPLLRRLTAQAASKSDDRAELDELLSAVKLGTVKHLNTARIETAFGTEARTAQVQEHLSISDISVKDKGGTSFLQEMREVGLKIELLPVISPDYSWVDANVALEFHTADPQEHREHIIDTQNRRLEIPLTDYHNAKVTTGITMPVGTARLLSLYKPTGKPEFETEDILQAIFITCDLLDSKE